jgi:hypothetical protein
MTYEEAKQLRDQIENNVELHTNNLKKFDQYRNNMGLIPDHIRESDEYKTLKQAFDEAFSQLRNFNKWYVKQFKKEIQKEQRELVKSRYKRAN